MINVTLSELQAWRTLQKQLLGRAQALLDGGLGRTLCELSFSNSGVQYETFHWEAVSIDYTQNRVLVKWNSQYVYDTPGWVAMDPLTFEADKFLDSDEPIDPLL